ncbi:hypothetical protein [Pontibacter chitinilyticus]|uniref:hypothetical protein n=1 Tax=Pontibacter chitinilyticus TaxID=2674989 RepID=UPI00321BC1E1
MKRHQPLVGFLTLLLLALCMSRPVVAQVPDTVYQKPTLPTGPTLPPAQQPRQQQQQVDPRPPIVAEPPQDRQQPDKDEKPQELLDRLYYGGSFGLQFGTYTNISLLPILGYRVTDRFNVGAGVVYHFIRSNGLSMHDYGGRAFTQVELVDVGNGAILAHAEMEVLSVAIPDQDAHGIFYTRHQSMALPLVGLGYRQRISDKASFDLLLLYNVNDDLNNPYSNPVIRAGFNIPFRQ